MGLTKRLGTIAIALSLLACAGGERVQGAPADGANILVPEFEWRVRSPAAMSAEYARAGKQLHDRDREQVTGFIGRAGGRLVIYTAPPVKVDDDVACALGHEVMHAALGDYHHKKEAK